MILFAEEPYYKHHNDSNCWPVLQGLGLRQKIDTEICMRAISWLLQNYKNVFMSGEAEAHSEFSRQEKHQCK